MPGTLEIITHIIPLPKPLSSYLTDDVCPPMPVSHHRHRFRQQRNQQKVYNITNDYAFYLELRGKCSN